MIRVLLSRGLRQHAGLLGILSVSLLLFQWAVVWVADRIEAAVAAVLAQGVLGHDLGGTASTSEIGDAIVAQLTGG